MEASRLKVKVGQHEFEAEGPAEQVAAQYESWKELVSNLAKVGAVTEAETREETIFSCDKKGGLISLKVHPPAGESRAGDAILLVLYGFRKAGNDGAGMAEVPVSKLKESLDVSGLGVRRIDRAAQAYIRSGYVLKSGRRRGGIYRLTNTGYARAEEIAQELSVGLEGSHL